MLATLLAIALTFKTALGSRLVKRHYTRVSIIFLKQNL